MIAIKNKYTEAFEKLKKSENSAEAHALKRFQKMGIPNRKSEVYKYSNLKHFKNLTPSTEGRIPHKLPEYFTHQYLLDKHLLVTVNGVFAESLSSYEGDEDGIHISCMCDARKEFRDIVESHYNETSTEYPDAFSEMNTAFAQCGIFIYATKNAQAKKPIVMLHLGYNQPKDSLICQRNLIVLEQNSEVELIEDYVNIDKEEAFNINHFSEYFIKQDARLKVNIYQEDSNQVHFIGNKFFELGKGSNLKVTTLNFQGEFIRNNFRVNLNGEHGEATLNGIFINGDKDHTDSRILIKHNAPHCESFQTFKGILDDQSTGVFNGKVFVAEGAQKTNAFQSNKNILLSEEATINTKPELEIYADDVKCSHGATCGQLDENAIFYAQTRGIPREKAKKLIVFAFAQEVIQNIDNELFKNFMERRLVHNLDLAEYSTHGSVQSGIKE
ncbi:Fe-S cluster assembly protein SufD [Chitinophagales bacterium]|nr:Fe-S cluster assembly protein SufD [Chitinophagales bacterium]